VRCGQQSTR